MPTISVIVPVYKVEQYLHQCIDSILAQTFTDFELILIDDGSPDNCGAICDEYAKQDARITVIHQENGGLSAARNAGIDIAKGEYLTFIDSDDWVHPMYLELLVRAVTDNSVDISVCMCTRSLGEIKSADKEYSCKILDGLSFLKDDHIIGIIACAKLYKTKLFDDIRFPIGKLHEDEATTYKLLFKAGNVVLIQSKLYFYTLNENSITNSSYSVKRLDGLEAIAEQCAFFRKIKRKDMADFAKMRFIDESCSHILKMEKAKTEPIYINKTRRKLRIRLIEWGFSLRMTPFRNKWEYTIAFPEMYKFFVCVRNFVSSKKG